MELQEIEVFIDEDGRVRIEVHGVKGKKCLDLTASLEEALGGEIESREFSHEAYQEAKEELETRIREEA